MYGHAGYTHCTTPGAAIHVDCNFWSCALSPELTQAWPSISPGSTEPDATLPLSSGLLQLGMATAA